MNRHYLRGEIRRTFRNPRYLVFSLGMPLVLFLLFSSGGDHDRIGGLSVSAYIMVSMATFGAMSGVFSTAGKIAMERSTGWNRQLRLTALTGRQYVLSKAITGFSVAVPALIIVFTAGALGKGVSLSPLRWLEIAGWVLVGLTPLAAMAVWLGYAAKPDSLQAVMGGLISLLALLGGLWVPIESFPNWVGNIAKALPTYWAAGAGRDALAGSWIGWHGVLVLVIWTGVLTAMAGRAYVRDTAKS
ncbi:MAG: type transport system permease protein [Frankiaceae bacterium]|nr:type transport system permease protein [Frankiaceae bacterium]